MAGSYPGGSSSKRKRIPELVRFIEETLKEEGTPADKQTIRAVRQQAMDMAREMDESGLDSREMDALMRRIGKNASTAHYVKRWKRLADRQGLPFNREKAIERASKKPQVSFKKLQDSVGDMLDVIGMEDMLEASGEIGGVRVEHAGLPGSDYQEKTQYLLERFQTYDFGKKRRRLEAQKKVAKDIIKSLPRTRATSMSSDPGDFNFGASAHGDGGFRESAVQRYLASKRDDPDIRTQAMHQQMKMFEQMGHISLNLGRSGKITPDTILEFEAYAEMARELGHEVAEPKPATRTGPKGVIGSYGAPLSRPIPPKPPEIALGTNPYVKENISGLPTRMGMPSTRADRRLWILEQRKARMMAGEKKGELPVGAGPSSAIAKFKRSKNRAHAQVAPSQSTIERSATAASTDRSSSASENLYKTFFGIESSAPTPHELLGIPEGADQAAIDAARIRRASALKGYATGKYATQSQDMANEVARAAFAAGKPAKTSEDYEKPYLPQEIIDRQKNGTLTSDDMQQILDSKNFENIVSPSSSGSGAGSSSVENSDEPLWYQADDETEEEADARWRRFKGMPPAPPPGGSGGSGSSGSGGGNPPTPPVPPTPPPNPNNQNYGKHTRLPKTLRKALMTYHSQYEVMSKKLDKMLDPASTATQAEIDDMEDLMRQQEDVTIGGVAEAARTSMMQLARRGPISDQKHKDVRNEAVSRVKAMNLRGPDAEKDALEALDKSLITSMASGKANEYLAGRKDKALVLRPGETADLAKKVMKETEDLALSIGYNHQQIADAAQESKENIEKTLHKARSVQLAKFSENFGALNLGYEYSGQVEGQGLYGEEAKQAADRLSKKKQDRIDELLPHVSDANFMASVKAAAVGKGRGAKAREKAFDAIVASSTIGPAERWEFTDAAGVKTEHRGQQQDVLAKLHAAGQAGISDVGVGGAPVYEIDKGSKIKLDDIGVDRGESQSQVVAKHLQSLYDERDDLENKISGSKNPKGKLTTGRVKKLDALKKRIEEEEQIVKERETRVHAETNIEKKKMEYGIGSDSDKEKQLRDQATYHKLGGSIGGGVDHEGIIREAESFGRVSSQLKGELHDLDKQIEIEKDDKKKRELILKRGGIAQKQAAAEKTARDLPKEVEELNRLGEEKNRLNPGKWDITGQWKQSALQKKYDNQHRKVQDMMSGGGMAGKGSKGWNYAMPQLAYGLEDFFQVMATGQGPMKGFLAAANNIGPAIGLMIGSATGASVAVAGMLAISALVEHQQKKDEARYKRLADAMNWYTEAARNAGKAHEGLVSSRSSMHGGQFSNSLLESASGAFSSRGSAIDDLDINRRNINLSERAQRPSDGFWGGAGDAAGIVYGFLSDAVKNSWQGIFGGDKSELHEVGEDKYMNANKVMDYHRTLSQVDTGAVATDYYRANASGEASDGAVALGRWFTGGDEADSVTRETINWAMEEDAKRREKGGMYDVHSKKMRAMDSNIAMFETAKREAEFIPENTAKMLETGLNIGRETGDYSHLQKAVSEVSSNRGNLLARKAQGEEAIARAKKDVEAAGETGGEYGSLTHMKKMLWVSTGGKGVGKDEGIEVGFEEAEAIRKSDAYKQAMKSKAPGNRGGESVGSATPQLQLAIAPLDIAAKETAKKLEEVSAAAEATAAQLAQADAAWAEVMKNSGTAAMALFQDMPELNRHGVWDNELAASKIAGATAKYQDPANIAKVDKKAAELAFYGAAVNAIGSDIGGKVGNADKEVLSMYDAASRRKLFEGKIGQKETEGLMGAHALNSAYAISSGFGFDSSSGEKNAADVQVSYDLAVKKRAEALAKLTPLELAAIQPMLDRQSVLMEAAADEKKMMALMSDPLIQMATSFNEFGDVMLTTSEKMRIAGQRSKGSVGGLGESQAEFLVIADSMKKLGMENKSFSQSMTDYAKAVEAVDAAIANSHLDPAMKAMLQGNLKDQEAFNNYQRAANDPVTQAMQMSRGGYHERAVYGGKSGALMNIIDAGAALQSQYETQRKKVKAQIGDSPERIAQKDKAVDALNQKQNRELSNNLAEKYRLYDTGKVSMGGAEDLYKSIQESLSNDPALAVMMEERDIARETMKILEDGVVSQKELAEASKGALDFLAGLYGDDAQNTLDSNAKAGVPAMGGILTPGGLSGAFSTMANAASSAGNWMMNAVGGVVGAMPALGSTLFGAPKAPDVAAVDGAGGKIQQDQLTALQAIEKSSSSTAASIAELSKNGLKVQAVLG